MPLSTICLIRTSWTAVSTNIRLAVLRIPDGHRTIRIQPSPLQERWKKVADSGSLLPSTSDFYFSRHPGFFRGVAPPPQKYFPLTSPQVWRYCPKRFFLHHRNHH